MNRADQRSCGNGWIEAPSRPAWARTRLKRCFDVFVSVIVLPIAIPLAASAALASALAFRANPLFRQKRTGLNGQQITVYKIRSLPVTFPADVGKRDLDITNLSKFSRRIRGSHVDEIPQLFNVLRKEMSLVGPRPMIDNVLQQLPESVRLGRASVLPGVTGPWQISSMGSEPLHECPDLDLRYANHGSLKMDIKCIWWSFAQKGRRHERQPEMMRAELGGLACQCVSVPAPFEGLTVPVCTIADPYPPNMDSVSGSDHIGSAPQWGEGLLQQPARPRS